MKLRSLLVCVGMVAFGVLSAQNPRKEIQQDIHLSAANYLAYSTPAKTNYKAAPAGYQPFYISTYMRHGSRYHISKGDYERPLKVLLKADSAGVLTAKGKEVAAKVERILQMSDGRLGELTPLGARQHQGIAKRMYQNFPEVFKGDAEVDARSTVVIRCILSMMAECKQLQALNPELRITNDASYHDMYYMNYTDKDLNAFRDAQRADALYQFKKSHTHPERLMQVLFNDAEYVKKNVGAKWLMEKLFIVAMNMQSHDDKSLDFYSLFTTEECYDQWTILNVQWYLDSGDSPITGRLKPYREANLLRNIIDTADKHIAEGKPGATMRFGHESCLLPLAVLMELGDCGYVTSDLETLADHWQSYRYFPMASNIQCVFYRKPGSKDVLVRFLLNEKEVTVPVQTDCAPFYHWTDVKKFFNEKLSRYIP